LITTHQLNVPGNLTFADPGLGKTAATLETIRILKKYRLSKRTLIVAPLAVVTNTWPDELAQWDNFGDLSYSILHGAGKKDLTSGADIHLVNPDGLPWLFKVLSSIFSRFPYDHLVLDESTLFKNPGSLRFKIIKKFLRWFPRRSLLTGTPIPNGLMDVFGQMRIADDGHLLGRGLTNFKLEYFHRIPPVEYDRWEPFDGSLKKVERRIAPVVCRVDAKDYKDFPPLKQNDIFVKLPADVQRIYDSLERELFATLDGEDMFLKSELSKYNATRQVAAGGLYKPLDWYDVPTKNRPIWLIHDVKARMLEHLISELRGKPLLVGYHFQFVVPHIKHKFIGNVLTERLKFINGNTKAVADKQTLNQWNSDKLQVLFGQPQAMGHGLNLHYGTGRTIAWFNPPDSFEQYDQFNRRIYGRNGVTEPVTVHNIIVKDTIEEVILQRLRNKDTTQKSFLNGLRAYQKRKYQ
jgi:SNF2 family DNA or RNA helicase